jgi:hypothetical protein
MKYLDGTPVSIGDHIWWNEGSAIGFVDTIVEGKEAEKEWGFDEPHILITSFHPFKPDSGGYVAYAISDFDDEGISILTIEEESMLAEAIAAAKHESCFREPFLIGLVCRDCKAESITFSYFDGSKTEEFARYNIQKSKAEPQR